MRTVLMTAIVLGGMATVSAIGADDPAPPTAKELATSQNNLKQIGLAFHNYSSAVNALPGDILDKNGKPLLSWRVTILSYIEQDPLYKQFKLDEPWDSENNKKLIEKMPKLYAPVRVKAKAGETFYQTFIGEGTIFVKNKPKFKFENMPDGTSNTGLVFEAGESVVWSKPADLAFDEKKPLPKLGGMFDGTMNLLMADGSVRGIKKGAAEAELKKVIMPADGSVIDFDKLSK